MTLDDLTEPMTVEEAREAIYTGLSIRGVRTSSWKPGATTRSIIAVLAVVVSAFSTLIANIAKGGFAETASGAWLTVVAHYVYGLTRSPGTFASGDLTFTNAGGGVFSGGVGDLVARSSVTNKTYRNTAAFSIGALASDVVIPFAAVELGSDSSASAGTIDELVTTLAGVSVTNAAALVGTDEESDVDLRARCAAKLGSFSVLGPRDAYEFAVRSARRADGTSIGVTRVRTTPDGRGAILVLVATPSGPVTGTATDASTDLGAVARAVWDGAEPLAVEAVVSSATAYEVAVTYSLWVRGADGARDVDIAPEVESALAKYLSSVPIGGDDGSLRRSALLAVIGSVRPDVTRVELTSPSADLALSSSSAPVLSAVTPTIHIGA